MNEDNKMIPLDIKELNTTKLILMMEEEPNTDRFLQIRLTKEQIKKVNEYLALNIFNLCAVCKSSEIFLEDTQKAYLENIKAHYPNELEKKSYCPHNRPTE